MHVRKVSFPINLCCINKQIWNDTFSKHLICVAKKSVVACADCTSYLVQLFRPCIKHRFPKARLNYINKSTRIEFLAVPDSRTPSFFMYVPSLISAQTSFLSRTYMYKPYQPHRVI